MPTERQSRVPRLLHARGTVRRRWIRRRRARGRVCVVLGVVYLCGAGPVPPWVGPAAAAAVDPRASTPRRRSNCRRTIGRILLDDDDAAARPPPPLPPQRGTVDGRRRPSSTTLRFLINTCIHYTRSDVLQ